MFQIRKNIKHRALLLYLVISIVLLAVGGFYIYKKSERENTQRIDAMMLNNLKWLDRFISGVILHTEDSTGRITTEQNSYISKKLNSGRYNDEVTVSVIDQKGSYLVHPEQQGVNVGNRSFFKRMIASAIGLNKIVFISEDDKGEEIWTYYTYNDDADVFIVLSGARSDLLLPLIKPAMNTFLLLLLFFVVAFGVYYWVIVENVFSSLKKVLFALKKASQGDLDVELNYQRRDDIGLIRKHLKQLIENMRISSKFAQQIEAGNFDEEFSTVSEADELGKSLLQMRDSLKQANQDAQKRQIEEKRRSWVAEGVANFSNMLRNHEMNMEELTFTVLKELINYVGLNQGGIFILNDAENKEDRILKLYAAYAYNRRKYLQKEISADDGLLGACVQERKVIYLTEIPEDYVDITSGLGKSKPTSVLIMPMIYNDEIFGVIELASLEEIEPYKISFIEKIGENVASTISNIKINQKTSQLLEQSQEQAEMMMAQEEEMKQHVEELQFAQEESVKKETIMKAQMGAISRSNLVANFDMKGELTNINEKFCKLLNCDFSEVRRKKFYDLFRILNESNESVQKLKTVLEGKIIDGDFTLNFNDHDFYVKGSFSPLKDYKNEYYTILFIGYNITESVQQQNEMQMIVEVLKKQETDMLETMNELKEAKEKLLAKDTQKTNELEMMNAENKSTIKELLAKEKQMRSILESSLDAVLIINAEGIVEFYNKSAGEMFGYAENEIIGKNVNLLMTRSDALAHDDYLRAYMKTGKSKIIGKGRDIVFKRKNGEARNGYIAVIATRSERGVRFTAFIRDVTEAHKVETEKMKQLELLMAKEFEYQEKIQLLEEELSKYKNH